MIALVAGVIAASTASKSMLRVSGSISTNTGRAPTVRMTLLVATHDSGVVITSSPGPTAARRSAISSAAVPELKTRTGRPPKRAESCASNSFTCGPDVSQPERKTSPTPAMVSSSMVGRVNGRKGNMLVSARAFGDEDEASRLRHDHEWKARCRDPAFVGFPADHRVGGTRFCPFIGKCIGRQKACGR